MSDFWSWNNAVDASGTLLSSPTGSAGMLLTSNVRDPRVGMIWRAGSMPAELRIALPTSGAISLFGLFGYNYQSLGEVTLKLGTVSGGGNIWQQSFDPMIIGKQAVFVFLNDNGELAPLEATHATIAVETGASLEIGRVWLGTADWQSAYGHTVDGSGWGTIDLSQKTRTRRSGAVLGDRGARLRTFTANYQALQPSEYDGSLFDMDDRGVLQQMLFVPDPQIYDPHRFAVLGTLDEIPSTNWRAFMTAGRSITITEAG